MIPPATLAALDWVVVAAYGLAVVAIATRAKRNQKDSKDYLLGGKRLPWWLIGMSIIATSFSSISLVTWTGYGYLQGPRWMQLQVGELAAILVVCALFLPYFARLDLTTAYEYLDKRFGRWARWIASGVFHVFVLARGGLFLFLTAEVLHVFTGLGVEVCILLVGLAAMVYSSTGGLGAVVWTDGLQMLLVVGGLAAGIGLVLADLPGGVADVWDVVQDPERPRALVLDDFSPKSWPTIWTSLVAYGVFALCVAGTNQQSVQRYLACKDLAASRRAALLSWAVGALVTALTLGLGVALFAWWGPREGLGVDRVFATFVAGDLPVGLAGVLAAAIFAASMSSIDSTIHSMATATLVDFVEPLRARPLEDARRLRLARALTLLYGLLAVGAAFVAMAQGQHVFKLLLDWLGFLAGPVLGLFLLGMLTRRVQQAQALYGLAAGYVVLVLVFTDLVLSATGPKGESVSLWRHAGMPGIWSALVGCGVTFGVAWILALAGGTRKAREAL